MQRCHTYKIAVSKYQGRCELFFLGGEGGFSGLGSQDGCERRIEVLVKIQRKKKLGGGGGRRVGGGSGWM